MKTQKLLQKTLDASWAVFKSELKSCQKGMSEEKIHNFRVAIRRLLSLMNLLHSVQKHEPKVKKLCIGLKKQMDNFDELHDVQVLLEDISHNTDEIPEIQNFQKYLQRKQKKLSRAAHKNIKSLKLAQHAKRIAKLKKSIRLLSTSQLKKNLFTSIDKAYGTVKQHYALINPEKPETIHHLRIAFKKFRYMLEVIYPMLEKDSVDKLTKMHEYQTIMGNIQDLETLLQYLSRFEKKSPADYNCEPVRSYYNQRHATAISDYMTRKDEVLTFWN